MAEKEYMVVLSGWAAPTFLWDELFGKLSQKYEIIWPNWDDVRDKDDFNMVAEDIIKNINGPVNLVCWSLGSVIALDLKNTDKVKNMILIGSTARFVNDANYRLGWPESIVQKMKLMIKKDLSGVMNNFVNNMFVKDEEHYLNSFRDKIKTSNKYSLNYLFAGLDFLIAKDPRDKLKDIKSRVLLIHGDSDKICPLASSKYIYDNLNCEKELKILENTGHIPFYTKEQTVYGIINNFLKHEIKNLV